MEQNIKILAVEAATENWSFSLLENGFEKGSRLGCSESPLSKNLLSQIYEMFEEQQIKISEIDLFAVSTGPGSFTGLRVAISVCQGLALANKKPLRGISILEILANSVYFENTATAFARLSNGKVCYQFFGRKDQGIVEISNIKICDLNDFFIETGFENKITTIDTYQKLADECKKNIRQKNMILGKNLAKCLGLIAGNKKTSKNRTQPIYL